MTAVIGIDQGNHVSFRLDKYDDTMENEIVNTIPFIKLYKLYAQVMASKKTVWKRKSGNKTVCQQCLTCKSCCQASLFHSTICAGV